MESALKITSSNYEHWKSVVFKFVSVSQLFLFNADKITYNVVSPDAPPLATHKDKRDRESVWVSLMKPRDQGARGDPKQRERGPNRFKREKGGCERGMARKTSDKIL